MNKVVVTVLTVVVFGILLTVSIVTGLFDSADDDSHKSESANQYVTKHYDYSFSDMLKQHMTNADMPKTDGAGIWYDANEHLTAYYANPKNVEKGTTASFQFLKLSGSSGVQADQLNDKILDGKGVLEGRGKDFVKAGEKHDLNEIYLVTHALHETGNGASKLAKGIKVGENKKGKPTRVTSSNRKKLKHIKKVYNFFGVGAADSHPIKGGAEYAYQEGWFSPEEAIVGGADQIDGGFVSKGQDTLYKMRWNPDNPGKHPYATDVGWAVEQTARLKEIYDQLQDEEGVELTLEVPEFNEQPEPTSKPTDADVFHVDKKWKDAGKKGKVTDKKVQLREGPTQDFPVIKKLKKGKKVTIIGENTGWYKVKKGKQEGWVKGDFIN